MYMVPMTSAKRATKLERNSNRRDAITMYLALSSALSSVRDIKPTMRRGLQH
jgi:hypothetical protein